MASLYRYYKSEKDFSGIDWNSLKNKYDGIRVKLVAAYPVGSDKHKSPHSLEELKKERIVSRIKYVKQKYRSAVDSGKVSGNGRIVSLFFDLCSDIWGGSPATESLVIGIDFRF